ncbi:hypothetical protein b3_0086 [Synechococcus phage B3]|nr:hypothetical protein b3_0086 [Synechococcus phage B3]QGT54700.1 hypothetical protein b23_0085 [Synechococcus phage B23]
MKQEIKERWVAALRSGEYRQTRSTLRDETGFCCLGVLTDLYLKENDEEWVLINTHYSFDDENLLLPQQVQEWAEIDTDPHLSLNKASTAIRIVLEGYQSNTPPTLAVLNDCGVPFKEIADVIENQL